VRDLEVIVVDNSGSGRARELLPAGSSARLIQNTGNAGFGAAVNQGIECSHSAFIATLNDDAVASPRWVEALLRAAASHPDAGSLASNVRLHGTGAMDSAGMLIAGDASSKQQGHGEPVDRYLQSMDVLLPSGSAAMYRRAMLDEIGGFDSGFFLYCEDTDLGLRALWNGWRCRYVADAVVEHRYSHTAGRASALKAYYVERNRLYVAIKNFPVRLLILNPFVAVTRYIWHLIYMLQGRGKASEFAYQSGGAMLVWFVVRAHLAVLAALPSLLRKRWRIQRQARITAREFTRTLREHWIAPRQVAEH
jgi:GT2 family glycosyltransferase